MWLYNLQASEASRGSLKLLAVLRSFSRSFETAKGFPGELRNTLGEGVIYALHSLFLIWNMAIRNMRLKLGKIKKHVRNISRRSFKKELEKTVLQENF